MLDSLSCTDHWHDCQGRELDLSGHSELRPLSLRNIPGKEICENMAPLQDCKLEYFYKQELMLKL